MIADDSQGQSVLVTHPDALADPDFRRALSQTAANPGFVAIVDREGHFELHALPLAHRPPVCQADLDLDAVFAKNVGVELIKTNIDPNLPAIFGVSPFPFLLPARGRLDFWTKGTDDFIYGVLNDRQLIRFRDTGAGARYLVNDLPVGKTIWMDCDGTELRLVKASSNNRPARLVTLQLPDGPSQTMELSIGEEVRAVYRYGDAILLIRANDVRAYSLGDGRYLGHEVIPQLRWAHGRYFRGRSGFFFAVWDGERVKFEPVTLPSAHAAFTIVSIFDRTGHPGPWWLGRNGVVSSESGEIKLHRPAGPETGLNFARAEISRDGSRIWVPSTKLAPDNSQLGCQFDLDRAIPERVLRFTRKLHEKHISTPTWNLYRIVECVVRYQDGIALQGRNNRWRKLGLDEKGILRITSLGAPNQVAHESMFNEPSQKTRFGCSLQAARFDGGSRIYLDSRGLLHLKSVDPKIPEVSLVLADGEVAGWTSDGHVCGPAYFFEGFYTSDPTAVFERVRNFFEKL
jgi:hypothetical protein